MISWLKNLFNTNKRRNVDHLPYISSRLSSIRLPDEETLIGIWRKVAVEAPLNPDEAAALVDLLLIHESETTSIQGCLIDAFAKIRASGEWTSLVDPLDADVFSLPAPADHSENPEVTEKHKYTQI